MFVLFSFLPSFLALSFILLSQVAAFTFIPGAPSECDNLSIAWTGGMPPFQLLLAPVFGTAQNISIPASAFNKGTGSFSMPLQMPQAAQLLLTMSDATGFNSGGTTPLLTVGPSKGGSSCNTTNPAIAFSFELNDALTQCRPFEFTGFTGAVQPVTITAIIPGGTAFELDPPVGSASFSWTANVINGTSMIFSMQDAQGRQGGTSDIRVVGLSDDSSCLNNLSPSSTPGAPSPTSTSSSSTSTSGSSPPPPHGVSIAAIAGTVIGALLFLAVIITLALFFLRKKLDSRTSGNIRGFIRTPPESEIDLTYDPGQAPVVTPYSVRQNHDPGLAPHPYPNTHPSFANTFQAPPHLASHYQPPSQYQHPEAFRSPSHLAPGYPSENPVSDSSGLSLPRTEFEPIPQTTPGQSASASRNSMSTSRRKSAMTGVSAYKPSRFVVHTDAEDELPLPNGDGVVELPPQYSERRHMVGVTNPTPDSNAGHLPGS